METQQLHLMPGKQGLKGMALMAKRVSIFALACVFSYTTAVGQTNRLVTYTAPFKAGDIKDNNLGVAIKLTKGDIKDFSANSFSVNVRGQEKTLSIRSLIIKGEYMLATLDASNISTDVIAINDGGGSYGDHTGGSSNDFRLTISGTRKEITIDNVSGVISDDDQGSAAVVVVDYTKLTAVYDGTISTPSLINTPNGGNNGTNAGEGSRGDDIITKDEVQGFVSAYPNPARGSVKIKSSHNKVVITEITVISAIGTKVTTQRPDDDGHMVTIDTQNIPAGIYFLSVKTTMGDVVKRIVIVD